LNQLGICHQIQSLELGEPEAFASPSTLRAIATHFDNKFEGSPVPSSSNSQILSELRNLCYERALAAFSLDSSSWGVTLQSVPADTLVVNAIVPVNGRVIGLEGNWESIDLVFERDTSRISMDGLARATRDFRPHVIIAGGKGYPRHLDYGRLRKIADSVGAILVADLAQTAGLVSAGVAPSPFEHSDIVLATAHRTAGSFRSDLVFYRTGALAKRLSGALQEEAGIPQTAAVAVGMKEAGSPEFKKFQYSIVDDMKRLAVYLTGHGLPLLTGGTDYHFAQLDLRQCAVDAGAFQALLDSANISTAIGAGGLTISSPALTERGLRAENFERVGEFLIAGAKIATELWKKHSRETFLTAVKSDAEIAALKKAVVAFARQFPLPSADRVK
jgi:glycine hydroxymethyltransferase